MAAKQLYQDDLAHIHIAGYGFHWQAAALAILKSLQTAGIASGTVLDLGCGGGQWLARLIGEGYRAVGVDISPAMLRAARKTAPAAKLIHGSIADVRLPPCDAVTAIGEPLNYLNSVRSIRRALNNVHKALRPGGLFIFDVRTPATKPVETRIAARLADDWACIATIDESPTTQRIVRRITTFRRHGDTYRRAEELHQLQLVPKPTFLSWLKHFGFQVQTSRTYGDYRLSPRQLVFLARKRR